MEKQNFKAVNGTEVFEEAFCDSDSHDGLRRKLSQAIDGKVQSGDDMDGDNDGAADAVERQGAGYPLHYVQQVHDKHVIYSMNGKNFAHKYEKDGEGDVHLKGKPTEVEHSFEPMKTKESFTESFSSMFTEMDLPVEANTGLQLINESYGDNGEITFTMIKPGLSKNNRYYGADMLKRDYKVFEGAKMFVNHQTDKEASVRPEGDIRDWAANVTKVWPESDGTIKATAVVINPTIKETLRNLATAKQLNTMGISIRAMGEASDGEVNGKKCKVVEGIKAARSVDFVTFPGAGGQVESLQ
jgi:hypothetical protein